MGESFKKVSGYEDAYYGHKYRERKELRGRPGRERFERRDGRGHVGGEEHPGSGDRAVYESGRLPAGRLDLRATRWTSKLFLSHWHEVAYLDHYGTPAPQPYAMSHLGHVHYEPPPPG